MLSGVNRFRLLDEFKTGLVPTASHELKTPLDRLVRAVPEATVVVAGTT